jgi:hypothetical protein
VKVTSHPWPTGSCCRSSRLPCGGLYSALCPINLVHRQALSLARPLPSILSAGSNVPPLFEDFAGTTGLSDFPPPCIAVVSLWVHGADLCRGAGQRRDLPASVRETDVSPREVLACVHGVFDPAGPGLLSLNEQPVLPSAKVESLGIPDECISGFNGQPARTPVNASSASLRMHPHDSGPVWLATPSPYGTFIHNTSPALAGAPTVGAPERAGGAVGSMDPSPLTALRH